MTISQRDEALVTGNHIRSVRAQIKTEIRAASDHDGKVRLAEIIEAGIPRALDGMYAFELLMLSPRVGDVKVRHLLRRAGVYPLRRAALLTDRQRHALARALRDMTGRS